MDKEQRRSRQMDDTVRVRGVDDQAGSLNHNPRQEGAQRPSNKIRVEQLRRDQEASKRLREEAYQQRRMAQGGNRQASQQFEAAQRVANGQRQRPPQGHPPHVQRPQMPRQAQHGVRQQPMRSEATARPACKQAPHKQAVAKPAQKAEAAAQEAVNEKLKKQQEKQAKPKQEAVQAANDGGNSALKKAGKRGCGCFFFVLLFILAIGIAFATLWAVRAHQAPTPIENIPVEQQAAVAKEREKSNVYILVAGTDQRADEASRSDTIIYAAVRPVDRKVEMVSIPRDTLVNIPEVGDAKVNSALAYGGMDLLSETVSDLTNNPVDHTVLVNFQSFAKIIDAMGGIKMNVPEKMYLPEEGIDLEAGEQKLNGEDALAFVRWRGDGMGDIGRMERQSQFMQAVMDKMRHLPPWRWATTLWAVSHEIDTDLSTMDILNLAWRFIGMDKGALEYQAFELNPTYIDGVSYVLLDDQNVDEVVQKMKYGMVIDTGYDELYDSEETYNDDGTDY